MTTNQFWTAVEKAKKVIDSCVTREQLNIAVNYYILLSDKSFNESILCHSPQWNFKLGILHGKLLERYKQFNKESSND